MIATPRLSLDSDKVCRKLLGKSVYQVFFPDRPDDYNDDVSSRFMADVCVLMMVTTHPDKGLTMESVTLQVVNAEEYEDMSATAIFDAVTRPGRAEPGQAELARVAELERKANALIGKSAHDVRAKTAAGEVREREATPIAGLGSAGAIVQETHPSKAGPTTSREVYFIVQATVFRLHSEQFQDAAALTRAAKLIAGGLAKLPKPR